MNLQQKSVLEEFFFYEFRVNIDTIFQEMCRAVDQASVQQGHKTMGESQPR